MFLALREMKRAKARFALLVAAVGLLVFLILTQQALQNGLITSFVGALRRQSAPVLVYAIDGQRTLQGSVVLPPLEQAVAATSGVAETGRIGQGTYSVSVDGAAESDAAVFGYEKAALGGPDAVSAGRMPQAPGEAVGSNVDFELGQRVRVVSERGTGGPELTVVGLATEAQIQVTPTLFVAWPDYEAAARAANPDADVVLPNVIGVRPADGVAAADLIGPLNAASDQADALTRDQAAEEAPGVAEVKQSFNVIFLLFALVVPLVTGLFFLIVTFQKSRALTLLRAMGAPAGVLVRSLFVQVVLVIGGGIIVGTAMFAPLTTVGLGSLALRFEPGAVGFWAALLLTLGVLSAMVAAKRVLAIDPVEATTGGGGR